MSTTIEVRTSGIWQTNSTVICGSSQCLVVDPAYFPRELAELAQLATAHGGARAVVFTHGHWDHVIGWQQFPDAEVWASASLATAVATGDADATRNLANAADFDARWYVERSPALRWPDAVRALGDGERVDVDGVVLDVCCLRGHSADAIAVVVDGRWLLPGDYLSPCEIPFIRDPAEYLTSLATLTKILHEVDEVIPGHGPRLTGAEALAIAEADVRYIESLLAAASDHAPDVALALELPRAAQVPGMVDEHRSNCVQAGLVLPG